MLFAVFSAIHKTVLIMSMNVLSVPLFLNIIQLRYTEALLYCPVKKEYLGVAGSNKQLSFFKKIYFKNRLINLINDLIN